MEKTIFVIPGFKHKITDAQYQWMKPFFKRQGFRVKMFPVHWHNKVMGDYVREFQEYYEEHKTKKNYVLGFSFGAMVAFISGQMLNPDRIYLCSLSPYFKEDINKLKPYWKKSIEFNALKIFKN